MPYLWPVAAWRVTRERRQGAGQGVNGADRAFPSATVEASRG